ncbi:MAG: hypothetical protein ACC608_07250 [Anaerofustis sp.]
MSKDKRVIPNYQHWIRGGKIDPKKHIEMTQEELKHVALCKGIKDTHPCKNPLYVCTACGNYGCSQETLDKCTEQGFKNDKCLHCGSVATRVPIMQEEFDEIMKAWENENQTEA